MSKNRRFPLLVFIENALVISGIGLILIFIDYYPVIGKSLCSFGIGIIFISIVGVTDNKIIIGLCLTMAIAVVIFIGFLFYSIIPESPNTNLTVDWP